MKKFRSWSLGARMAVLFSALFAAIGVFMLAFFPQHMERQAAEDAEERASSIAQVMSTALAPALEFDDPDNARQILAWLGATSDARFGLVRRHDGTRLAAWGEMDASADRIWPTKAHVERTGSLLLVTTPIGATGGTVHVGFSLAHLVGARGAMRHTVTLAVMIVVAVGVLATLLLAAYVMRPIRALTRTALQISRGELPPSLPAVDGTDEIMKMAAALRAMLERVHEVGQQDLIKASRQAGMAEVATGVLHNVGNVLTSVNVTVELLHERVSSLPIERLSRLHELLSAALAADALDRDRLVAALKFIDIIGTSLATSRAETLGELRTLADHVEHIKRVVAMQNAYARLRSAAEPTRVAELVSEAVELGCPTAQRGDIEIDLALDDELVATSVMIDRHRILQILVNLVSNARDAVFAIAGKRQISIAADREGDRLRLRVVDTGVGIPADLAAKIFGAGVTSKANGHGYGLHSSALAARQIGGSLGCSSAGEGQGATFTLIIPIEETRV